MRGALRRFEALDHGALMGPDDWTGVVQAVYANAINILRADALVVSIVADVGAMTAMSVHSPGFFDDPAGEVVPGQSVARTGSLIEIAEFARFDLARSRPWQGTIDGALVSGIPVKHVSAARNALLTHGKPGGLLGLLSRGEPANLFVETARAILSAGRYESLVGLGPGLTPAGDDFLAGALMAPTQPAGMRRVETSLSGTTAGGRTLLWMALQRSFPAYLRAFVETIAHSGSTGEIRDAVRAACAHGETSGTDSLTGFCWASDFKGDTPA
jgi:hypothetical protein